MDDSSALVRHLTFAFDALALLAVALSILILGWSWSGLPDRIAIHFGLDGQPDNWGSKRVLLLLPAAALVFALGAVFISWLPGPARDQLMLRLVAAETVWLVTYAEWRTIQVGLGRASGLGVAFLPIVILAPGLALVVYALLLTRLPT